MKGLLKKMAELLLYGDEPVKQKPRKSLPERVEGLKKSTGTLSDSLVLLTISFWYFFWTGLAVVLGKSIPSEWMSLSKQIAKKKIADKIDPLVEPKIEKTPVHHRVVDLETQLPVLSSPLN
jgi:hypothetical protein